MQRSFLFLQGTASHFFGELAQALKKLGIPVAKVNYCGGDVAYSISGTEYTFDRPIAELRDWYARLLDRTAATDLVMFGDCRPIHVPIHKLAEERRLNVHVFEEGYVRPDWITLEQYGVNGRSRLTRDPSVLLESRDVIPPVPTSRPTGYDLRVRAYHDMRYRLANMVYSWRFPHYISHRPNNGFVEYAGLAAGTVMARARDEHADRLTDQLIKYRRHFYLVPLQLNSDAQVVHHSPFGSVLDFVRSVLQSFARCAPRESFLIVKMHPLDTGLINYRRILFTMAQEFGVQHRVCYIQSGHLPTLLAHAAGVVVVNSTVGLSALHHEKPLIALGSAIYDMQGMTWQGGLDDFWQSARPPDRDLYQVFLNYVIHHTQINGDFYTRTGIEMAVAGAVRRLEPVGHA